MINIIDQYKTVDMDNEVDYTRFMKLGKDYFEFNSRIEFDYFTYIKDSTKLSSFSIPEEYKEIFIPRANAAAFWTYDSWLMLQIEDYIKVNFLRAKNVDVYKSIKDNFTKWATTKLKNEKEYYANNTINLIERDVYKQNFFKHIINGIILLSHPVNYNANRVLTCFETAKDLAKSSRLSENIKNELSYIITLNIGFAHLRDNAPGDALNYFKEALELKKPGITAKIYCALSEVMKGNIEGAEEYLNDVLAFDFNRLELALSLNSFGMFNFFIKTGFFQNIFFEMEFYHASDLIERIVHQYYSVNKSSLETIKKKIEEFKKKNIKDYLTTEISHSVAMLDKISQLYIDSKNVFIIGLSSQFENKFNDIIQGLIGKLKENLDNEISHKLSYYERMLSENLSAEKHALNEIENFKIKSREDLVRTLESIEENYNMHIKLLEERIENIPFLEKYNPQRSFSVNMSNNFIVAFIVMIIGAFAGNSSPSLEDSSRLNSFLSALISTGVKWGLISFFIGTLISLIISAMVLIEKVDEKQKLTRKINSFKKQKTDALNEAKVYSEHREKVTLENYNNNILQYRKNIKDITGQRDYEHSRLSAEASEKIKAFEDLLAPLLN
ncbi:MAG: hypothetical protein AB1432_06440 [Bacteroidota bacterium]